MNTQLTGEAPKKKQGFFGKVTGGLKGLFRKKTKKNTVKGIASTTVYTLPTQNTNEAGMTPDNVKVQQKDKFGQFMNKTKKKAMEKYGDAKAYVGTKYDTAKYAREHRNKVLYTNFLGLYRIEYYKQDKPNEGSVQMYSVIVSSKKIVSDHMFMHMIFSITNLTENHEGGPMDYNKFFSQSGNSIHDNRAYVREENINTMKILFEQAQEYYDTHPDARRALRNYRTVEQTKLGRLASNAGNRYRTAKAGVKAGYEKTKKAIGNATISVISKAAFMKKLASTVSGFVSSMKTAFKANPGETMEALHTVCEGLQTGVDAKPHNHIHNVHLLTTSRARNASYINPDNLRTSGTGVYNRLPPANSSYAQVP